MTPEQYERYVANYVTEKWRFTNVYVTPQSGDFGADVIGRDPKGYRACIQCKLYNKAPVGIKAVQEIYAAKGHYNCQKAFVFTNGDFTDQAHILARELGVSLVTLYPNIYLPAYRRLLTKKEIEMRNKFIVKILKIAFCSILILVMINKCDNYLSSISKNSSTPLTSPNNHTTVPSSIVPEHSSSNIIYTSSPHNAPKRIASPKPSLP